MSDSDFVNKYLNDFSTSIKPSNEVIEKIINAKEIIINANKNNKKIMIFVNELKVFDKKFCKNSVKILDKIFKKKEVNFYFRFNSYTKFYFKKKKIPMKFLLF